MFGSEDDSGRATREPAAGLVSTTRAPGDASESMFAGRQMNVRVRGKWVWITDLFVIGGAVTPAPSACCQDCVRRTDYSITDFKAAGSYVRHCGTHGVGNSGSMVILYRRRGMVKERAGAAPLRTDYPPKDES